MLKVESFETEDLLGGLKNKALEEGNFDEDDEELNAGGIEVGTERAGVDAEEIEIDAEQRRREKEAEALYGTADEVSGPVGKDWEQLAEEAECYTITKLTGGVKDPNRVNVFLDGHFAFSLDVTQVVDFEVKVHQKITPEKYAELKQASEFGKLYQRTLEWAISRPHSVREAQNYLKRRQIKRRMLNRQREREGKTILPEIDEKLSELVIKRLVEKKYLDDQKFAEYFVENRNVRRGTSQKKLKMELAQKGVKQEIAVAALEKVPRDEDEEILKVIKKKRRKYDDFHLVGYLVRQGFNFQKAKEAVENYQEDDWWGL